MPSAAAIARSFPARVVRSFLDDECPFLAGALAYQIFFALVPLLALVVGVLGFAYGDETSARQLARILRDVYPSATNDELRIVREVVAGRAVSLGIGLVGTLIGTTAIFGSLDSALAAILGRANARSFARRYVSALGFVAVVMAIALASLALSYGASAAAGLLRSAGIGSAARTELAVAGVIVGAAAGYLLFLLVYRTVPRTKVPWGTARLAALVSAVLWEVAKLAFGSFTRTIGSFTAYGPLAFVAGLLTWIYLTAVIILVGAEVIKIGRAGDGG